MQSAEEVQQQQVEQQPKVNWKGNLISIVTFVLAILILIGVAIF